LRKVGTGAFGAVALALLVAAVWQQRAAFSAGVARLSWQAVVVAGLSGGAGLYASFMTWRSAMASVGAPLSGAHAGRVYFLSQLGKYLPGSVWPVLAQMEMTKARGIGRSRSGAASILAMVVSVVTSSAVAAVALAFTVAESLLSYWYLFLAVPVGIAILAPPVLGRIMGAMSRLTGGRIEAFVPTWRGILASTGWALVMWFVYGLHALAILNSLAAPGHVSYVRALGAFSLAWVVGFLVVIAPAGIGPREGALVVALSGVLGAPDALVFAVVSRVMLTLADGLAGGAGVLLTRGRRR
jgi:uncharacterized membrane protein YbhN (UPF0104 family)